MYRIGTVCERTGIRPETLRAWERRYGLLEPRRTPSGYRLYAEADIAVLQRVKELIDAGLSAGEAASQVLDEGPPIPTGGGPDLAHRPLRGPRRALLTGLLDLDEEAVTRALRLDAPLPFAHRILGLLVPVLRELRRLDGRGEAGPGRRAFTERRLGGELAAIVAAVGTGPARGPLHLVGSPAEGADVPATDAAAALLALRGTRVLNLGRVDPEALLSVAATKRPDRISLVLGQDAAPAGLLPLLARAAEEGLPLELLRGADPAGDESLPSLESLVDSGDGLDRR